jgi:GAF domain-containing protein
MDATEFRQLYAESLQRYTSQPSEEELHTAYVLGREAVESELTVLELAAAHHDNLLVAVRAAESVRDAENVTRFAGDFFLESLSAFEMLRRGYREAHDIVALERRHAAMLRQLSNFLADASLASNTPDSVEEVLTLVVEHARELVGADCAYATVDLSIDGRQPVVAASFAEDDPDWAAFLSRGHGLESWEPSSTDDVRERLAAAITALDGRQLGSIHLFDKTKERFADVDEAVLAHLAQMASAAIERAQAYQRSTEQAGPDA